MNDGYNTTDHEFLDHTTQYYIKDDSFFGTGSSSTMLLAQTHALCMSPEEEPQ